MIAASTIGDPWPYCQAPWQWSIPTSTLDQNCHQCPHCGMWHGQVCPRVKAIEYHENGTIKRVEYRE